MADVTKSPWIMHYDGSSCNGYDIEVLACLTPLYDIERFGIINTGNPKHADILLITGSVNSQNESVVKQIYEQMTEPKVVCAIGICACNGGVYINTAGVGFVDNENVVSTNLQDGDCVIVSGTMGDHHATILSARMEIENNIKSDNAPLTDIVKNLIDGGIDLHCMRDVTRGGLGTVLNELANASRKGIEIKESAIPISDEVKAFSKILGLNILHMGNEGKLVAIVPSKQADKAVQLMKQSKYGENAAIIGKVTNGDGVTLITPLGGQRKVNVLIGEGLPRIC